MKTLQKSNGYQCFKDTDHRRHYCRIILRHRWCGKRECFHFTPAQGGLTSLSTVFQHLQQYFLQRHFPKSINRIIAVPISTFIIVVIFNVLTLLGVPSGTFQEFLLGSVVIIFAVFAQRGVKGVVK